MRFLIPLIILLMSAICSCRSTKQTAVQTADSTRVEASEVKASMSAEEILSLLTSSTDIDLAGITVEYYPPDTAHPGARASPKSVSIDAAKVKNQTEAARHETASTMATDSINATMEQTSEHQSRTDIDTDILHPSDWVVVLSLGGTILIVTIFLILTIRHNGNL